MSAVVGSALVLLGTCGSPERETPASAPSPSTDSTKSTTSAPLVGPPPEIPWWSHGKLHLEEGVIRTPMRQIVARGGTTIVGRATQHGSTWMVLRGDGLADLLSTRSLGVRPVLSANGLFAAWTTSVVTHRYNEFDAETTFTVTAYDVGRGTVTGATVIDSRTACWDGDGVIDVAGVDNDGTVVVARYSDRVWTWRPGGHPAELIERVRPRDLPGNDQWPGGVSWTTTGTSSDPAVFAQVSTTGEVTRVGRVPQTQGGQWSPDGTSYAYDPYSKLGGPRPVVWRDGNRQTLHAPRGASVLAWESRHRVLLILGGDLDAPTLRIERCWVSDGRCEQAGPPLHHARLPEPSVF